MHRALWLEKKDDGHDIRLGEITEADLPEGDVLVEVAFSTLNYKDALAILGKAPIVRRWPMVPGIDCAGTVKESHHHAYKPGDKVILNGWGTGETRLGGMAGLTRVPGDWLVPLPQAFTLEQAMALGTAGYTAMLAVLRLAELGLEPEAGPILVSGAMGGVGSVALMLLKSRGYEAFALTGRPEARAHLEDLGAAGIVPREELGSKGKPLAKERWAGGIDAVGSHVLANLLAATRYGGVVAACGLAGGMDLPLTVAPFILRGVTLAGIDSVYASGPRRRLAWHHLASELPADKLSSISRSIALDAVESHAADLLAGKVQGRLVVRLDG